MANRAARRQMMRETAHRAKNLLRESSRAERMERLMQNGITPQDLEKAYDDGHRDGFVQAALPIMKSCYAAVCSALHDEFGFGGERCYRLIRALDEKIIWALNNQELVDETLEKTGLEIQFNDAFDRVYKTRESAARDR